MSEMKTGQHRGDDKRLENGSLRGGSFLIEDCTVQEMFTPEDLTEEHQMIARTTAEFIRNEVIPAVPHMENHEFAHNVRLLKEAGELGLLGAEIPEKYGGLDLDKISATLIAEKFSEAGGFAISYGAHIGIGTLPIVYFGTEEQKKAYLPDLSTGERIAAYALTEPSSGSDALSAKTTAVKSSDGKRYILNGQKQWITNASYADVFIVYAKIDGQHFTAFIVDRDSEGLSIGPEEHKMGIKSSSTAMLFLDEVNVPVHNVLGEIGKGHQIAFNVLNMGRYKLAAGCVGSSKRALELSIKYAKGRQQFKTAIANFNLIKNKLASMAVYMYANESMVFRTGGLIDRKLNQLADEPIQEGQEVVKAIAEYTIECSINKIFGSEMLDFVVDEAVQIHGGYGYMSEYEVENMYRDSRINRIFEGTSEINRLLIPATLLRRSMKGELNLLAAADGLQEELMLFIPEEPDLDETLAKEGQHVQLSRKIFLMIAGIALQKYEQALEKEQEILASLANMVIAIYAMESVLLRTEKAIQRLGEEQARMHILYTQVYCQEAFQQLEQVGRESLATMEEGDTLRSMLAILRKLTRHQPLDTIQLKREMADYIIQAEKYVV